jgi:mannose-6-phosphate isomerase-like protein (cupin superfamily)
MNNTIARTAVVREEDLTVFSRGNGVETRLVVGESVGARFTTGFTTFPAGSAAPIHYHNCDEQVTIIEGEAEAEIEGVTCLLKPRDSTFIPAGKPHRFTNVGAGPLTILWIYDAAEVTRTFADTGQTVDHLSLKDQV